MKNTSPWAVRALSRLLVMVMSLVVGLGPAASSHAQTLDPRAGAAIGLASKASQDLSWYFDKSASLDVDFVAGGYWAGTPKPDVQSLNDLVGADFRRASVAYDFNASGLLVRQEVNAPRIPYLSGAPRGLLLERQTENRITDATGASQVTGVGNSNATAALSTAVGPDGAFSMERATSTVSNGFVQSGGKTIPGDSSVWTYSTLVPKLTSSNNVRLSLVLTGGSSASYDITFDQFGGGIVSGSGVDYGVIDRGSFWLPYISANIGNNTTATMRLYPVSSGTGSADFAYTQLEKGVGPTSRIKTSGSLLRRERDVSTFPVSALFGSGPAAFSITAKPPGGPVDRVIAQVDDDTESNRITVRRSSAGKIEVVVVSGGSTIATMDLGAHTALASTKVSVGWDGTTISAIRDGASLTEVASAQPAGLSKFRLGANTSATSLDGVITRLTAYKSKKASLFYEAQSSAFAVWGDSMAAGSGASLASTMWHYRVQNDLLRTRYVGAVSGETSTQMLARCLADTTHRNWVAIFWVGHNSPDATTDVANIQACIAHLSVDPRFPGYLVLLPTIQAGNLPGSTTYNKIMATRALMLSTFGGLYTAGGHVVDAPAALAAANDNSPQDLSDVANGWTPTSLRASGDTIHLGDPGQVVIQNLNETAMVAKGY